MAEPTPETADQRDDNRIAFLEPDPPHWVARGLGYVLILVSVAALVFSLLVQIPETVSSPFVLTPMHGTDPVRSQSAGVVAEVRVREGQSVFEGDILFVVHSTPTGDRSADLRALETQIEGSQERLSNEKRSYESQRLADEQEETKLRDRLAYLTQKIGRQRAIRAVRLKRYRDTLALYRNEIDITKKERNYKAHHSSVADEVVERFAKAYEKGLVSWLDYSNRKLEASKLRVELQQLARQLDSAGLRVSQLEAEHENQEIDWELNIVQLDTEASGVRAALSKLRHESAAREARFKEIQRSLGEETEKAQIRIAALKKELVHSENNEVSVPAPCSGMVLRLEVNRAQAVVGQGDVLCELVCSGERLQAELKLAQSGIGRIKPGQRVKLLYDAFPYQRYGVRYGTVRWVSPATVATADGAEFRALVDIERAAILVEGQPRPLRAGMRGTGRVILGKRTLIAYAFEPLRQLRENLADAPARSPNPQNSPEIARRDGKAETPPATP